MGNANLYAEHEKQDWSPYGVLNRTLFRPFQMLALEPILLLMTIYSSIVYGLLYALFEALPVVFMIRRNFNEGQGGLIFIGVGVGTTVGCFVNAYLSRNDKELIKKWKGFPPPEKRLRSAMVGAPLLVISIFWLGWTGEYASIPWYVPGLSTIPLGAGISLIFITILVGCVFLKYCPACQPLAGLLCGDVPNVQCLCLCRKCDRTVRSCCRFPVIYYPNVHKCKFLLFLSNLH